MRRVQITRMANRITGSGGDSCWRDRGVREDGTPIDS